MQLTKNILSLILTLSLFSFHCKNSNSPNEDLTEGKELKTDYGDLQEALKNKDYVKSLTLREYGYSEIPEVIYTFSNLEHLDLYLNKLKTISPKISRLKKLKSLSLSYNYIKALPDDFFSLKQLEYLSLLDNELKSISPKICNLSNLKTLNLTENRIAKLPNCISEIKSLKFLGFDKTTK